MSKIANISYDNSINKFVAIYKGQVLAKGNSADYLQKVIVGGFNKKAEKLGITGVEIEGTLQTGDLPVAEPAVPEFSINERFEFVEEFAEMIADKVMPSLLLVGRGGIGKTSTILKTLKKKGLQEVRLEQQKAQSIDENGNPITINVDVEVGDYVIVKGFSTAKAMFRTLYENSDRTLIFDDCDSVFKDPNAVNVLKAALDSYETRWVSWNSENPFSDLPRRFLFKGQVIFISNRTITSVDQAVRTRSTCVDLSMTDAEMIDRMEVIIKDPEFLPEFDSTIKREALDFVAENLRKVADLSLRTLIQITKIRATANVDKWKRLALYAITQG